MKLLRRRPGIIVAGMLLCATLLIISAIRTLVPNALAASTHKQISLSQQHQDAQTVQLRQLHNSRLASSVHVLASLPPTTILQFPLVPSGIKTVFPNATALVTIVRGDRDNSASDTVTVDVQHMPPNITFTIFLIEQANKPFGNVEYVADLTTRGDGSGETVFHIITFVAFAMDARNPGSSKEVREGLGPGIQLEHMGMWFSQLQDAEQVLNDDTLKGTIFDGGNPPLHAGPQAMTDGQTAPVF
jgi:hypothetical protein